MSQNGSQWFFKVSLPKVRRERAGEGKLETLQITAIKEMEGIHLIINYRMVSVD